MKGDLEVEAQTSLGRGAAYMMRAAHTCAVDLKELNRCKTASLKCQLRISATPGLGEGLC